MTDKIATHVVTHSEQSPVNEYWAKKYHFSSRDKALDFVKKIIGNRSVHTRQGEDVWRYCTTLYNDTWDCVGTAKLGFYGEISIKKITPPLIDPEFTKHDEGSNAFKCHRL